MSLLIRIARSNGNPRRTIEALRLTNELLIRELNYLDAAIRPVRNLSQPQRCVSSDKNPLIEEETLNLDVLRCFS